MPELPKTGPLEVKLQTPVSATVHAGDIPGAVRVLDMAMAQLQEAVGLVADDRARFIAHLASTTSVRAAAEALDLSPAAVSKAIARAELSGQAVTQ